MTNTQLYWLVTLPKISAGLGMFLFMCGLFGAFLYLVIFAISHDKLTTGVPLKFNKKIFFSLIFLLGVGGALLTFVPTSKEIIAIYGINYLTNDKNLQEIPPKLFELMNIKMEDILKDIKQ